MECEFPSENSTDKDIKELLCNSKNIAIVGLSPEESKASHMVAKYLQSQGYKIFPLYPKEDMILGEKVYRSLEEIPYKIDIVNLFRKASVATEIVKNMKVIGDIKAIWLQLGIVNNEAAKIAKNAGFQVVQNRCIMIEHKKMDEC